MRLGLSSAAAPGASMNDLIHGCSLRGLAALELRAGDAHGITQGAEQSAAGATSATTGASSEIEIAGYHTDSSSGAPSLARLSERLGAPIIVADDCGTDEKIDRARRINAEGGRALVLACGDAAEWKASMLRAEIDFAWQVDAASADFAAEAGLVLTELSERLRYIRFIGGGPEAAMQEGRGIGTLMGSLALAGFDGPVILTPSSTRYRVAWESWLGRRGGWGCGSRVADADLVHLPVKTTMGGT